MGDAEELQKVFKTLADPTRVRILRLLEREELVVQELMEVLSMAQSRVSRHLAILREAGLLDDRRDGTYVAYRFVLPEQGAWRDAWSLVTRNLADDPTTHRDDAALDRVIDARSRSSRSFFDTVGPEWDALRKVFDDDLLRARAVARLVPPGLRVADVGTGTGVLAFELARLGLTVVGVDNSRRMIEAAREKLAREEAISSAIEFREGDGASLPLADDEVDAAFAHMVLHSVDSPSAVVAEMARVVKPGGAAVAVDFVRHDQEWMRRELGLVWLGFDPDEILEWFRGAGLCEPTVELFPSHTRDRSLPSTFIAWARRPDPTLG
ncbi:MAG: ArsR/SmtB family transcription factor [Myxococcota bacterium]